MISVLYGSFFRHMYCNGTSMCYSNLQTLALRSQFLPFEFPSRNVQHPELWSKWSKHFEISYSRLYQLVFCRRRIEGLLRIIEVILMFYIHIISHRISSLSIFLAQIFFYTFLLSFHVKSQRWTRMEYSNTNISVPKKVYLL